MAEALLAGLLAHDVRAPGDVTVVEISGPRREALAELLGARPEESDDATHQTAGGAAHGHGEPGRSP